MLKVIDNSCEPYKGSVYSAGVDLRSREYIIVGPGVTIGVPLGVKIDHESLEKRLNGGFDDFSRRHYIALHPRSGLRKKGLIANTGIIDLDYPGEFIMIVHNPSSNVPYHIKQGDRVAQILLLEHKTDMLGIMSNVERTGGFGSTGK